MFRYILLGITAAALAGPALAHDVAPAADDKVAEAPETAPAISRTALDALIAKHAQANGIPEALVHRVIVRESRYNPRAIGKGGAMGLMQIKHATARGLGYGGAPSGLLDAETNLTYAVRYLAGAYRAAEGNADRAVSYFAKGYYFATRHKALKAYAAALPAVAAPAAAAVKEAEPAAVEDVAEPAAGTAVRPVSEGLF
jgi:soluble lytic murein transglycosylase-like protein